MSEFCNICAKRLGLDKPTINVYKEFDRLEDGYFVSVGLCEGCGLVAVAKLEGQLKVQTLTSGWKDYKESEEENE